MQQLHDMGKFSVISRNSLQFFKTQILLYDWPLVLGIAFVQSCLLSFHLKLDRAGAHPLAPKRWHRQVMALELHQTLQI